ncbi:calcium/calmodulin-dependent protein kinase type I [Fimicolochytrium jonesii]|uniref:calcium/calmodulin-dependent protein kinase type I n=1 Tax=Fimicolochytrium jonesii TaxID=1396493 RepID=UPI0022FE8DCD|nr:calcium/calmodulin-dependent protein kinase type I [Fimicolochytrium jonesii]KAI8825176.1 calcium/calmodulin-dependent protein kinase type I [Fimicolochytrium jonesii]
MKRFFDKILHPRQQGDPSSRVVVPPTGGSRYSSTYEAQFFTGKQLGVGTFAIVKECTRKADSKKFAAKIIDKAQLKDQLHLLRGEIDVLRKVHHTHIISLEECFETRTHVYLITELASGGELFDRILQRGSYTEKDAAVLVRQLLTAIEYLHDMDIVHRDLKPENLLFRDSSENADLMVTDFGLSRMVQEGAFLQTACGTPHYVAPEILKQKGHGKGVDMWAIGVIAYVIMCGYTPFWAGQNESHAQLFHAILTCDYQFDEEYWCEVSQPAKDFISSLLVVDPTRRATVKQALAHPWLSTDSQVDLMPNVKKNFNARRTFKRGMGYHNLPCYLPREVSY